MEPGKFSKTAPERDALSSAIRAAALPNPIDLAAFPSRNALEIQFFGLQRSGNHAVLSWIFRQFDEPVFFFNNVSHFTDPFLNFHFADIPNTVPVRRAPSGDDAHRSAARTNVLARLESIRAARKHLLAYSYENLALPRLQRRALVDARDERIGHSEKVRRVLLLRDFYNWIASRIRLFENKSQAVPAEVGIDRLISLWIVYAREFIGKTDFMRGECVVRISYNRWIQDEDYRTCLLDQLGVPLKTNTIDHVPDVGGGSSFDGNVAPNEAYSMRVTERWRYLLDDKFAKIVEPIRRRVPEIDAYNREIFGLRSPL